MDDLPPRRYSELAATPYSLDVLSLWSGVVPIPESADGGNVAEMGPDLLVESRLNLSGHPRVSSSRKHSPSLSQV